jgi:hypothetical protein
MRGAGMMPGSRICSETVQFLIVCSPKQNCLPCININLCFGLGALF